MFGTARKLMTEHREARAFHRVALALLNDTLRPYTARWHGWMTQDGDKADKNGKPILKFRDAWVRRKFREELRELQPRLLGFQKALEALIRGAAADPRWLEPARHPEVLAKLIAECPSASGGAELGEDLPLRLRSQVTLWKAGSEGREETEITEEIERHEASAILRRRAVLASSAVWDASSEVGDGRSGALRRRHSFGNLLPRNCAGASATWAF